MLCVTDKVDIGDTDQNVAKDLPPTTTQHIDQQDAISTASLSQGKDQLRITSSAQHGKQSQTGDQKRCLNVDDLLVIKSSFNSKHNKTVLIVDTTSTTRLFM